MRQQGYDSVYVTEGDGVAVAVTDPAQVKSATGNTGAFDGGNPDIRFNLDTSGFDDTTQEALRRAGVIQHQETLKEKAQRLMQDAGRRLVQGIFDQYAPIKEISEKGYMLSRQSRGHEGAMEVLLQHGLIEMDDDGAITFKDDGKGGFFQLMAELGGEHDLFLAWIAGNRADQILKDSQKAERAVNALTSRIAQLKKARKDLVQRGGAYDEVRALEMELKDAAQARAAAKKRAAVTERNFDPEHIEALKALNQGTMTDGRNRQQVYRDAHQRFKTMLSGVMDIAEKSGLIDGESREVWEKDFYVPFYRQIEEGKSGPTVQSGLVNQYAFHHLKGGKEATKDLMENTIANWRHLISASMKNVAAKETLASAAELGVAQRVPPRAMKHGRTPKNLVRIREKGKEVGYEVADPFMLDALKAIDFAGFDSPILKGMAKFKRWLTIGVTTDPAFKFWRNMMRDAVSSIANSELSYDPIKNSREGIKAQGSALNPTMLAGGALFRFGAGWEGERAVHARRKIDAMNRNPSTLNTKEKLTAFLVRVWDSYQEAGDKVENMQRAALYKQLREQGKSHLEASFAARDLMDFSLNGAWGAVRMASMVVPFMNARLQGMYKLARSGRADPRKMATVLMAAGMLSVGLLLAYRDDDDWKRREDWDRENYWWFKIGDKAMRIPKPFELGAVATAFERAVELGIEDEMDGERFARRMAAIVQHQLSMSPIPQALQPAIEIYANKDAFTGRPIEGMAMERLQKRDRWNEGTSEVARQLGKAGVLSPVQIDHLVRGYFGWLGAMSMSAADVMARPMLDRPDRSSLMTRRMTMGILEDLAKDPQRSRYVSQFYEDSQKIQQAYASMREAEKRGDLDRAEAIREDNPELRRRASISRKIRVRLSDLRSRKREIERSRDLTPLEKQRRIYQLNMQEDKLAQQIVPRLQE